jgi:hypothetical protein
MGLQTARSHLQRRCLRTTDPRNPDSLVEYKSLYDMTSYDLSKDKFMDIAINNKLLDLDDASLTVCLISRNTLGPDSLVQPSMDFTTPKVKKGELRQSLHQSWW